VIAPTSHFVFLSDPHEFAAHPGFGDDQPALITWTPNGTVVPADTMHPQAGQLGAS